MLQPTTGRDRPFEQENDVTVSAMLVRGLSEALHHAGHDVKKVTTLAGLDAARMSETNARVSLTEFDGLVNDAVASSGDPLLGLHWGERSPMMQLDLVSTLIATAPSLHVAIMTLV